MIYFQDNEIKIRDVIAEDINYLFSWNIDREANEHDPKPIPRNSKELQEECANFCNRFETQIINEKSEDRKYIYFIITNHKDEPIGFVNLFSIDKLKKQGEMGVVIGDKRYWKKGIGYKSVSTVLDYIFNELNIDRIYIETGESNIAALTLFEKLGFNVCGDYLEDGNFKFIVMEKINR